MYELFRNEELKALVSQYNRLIKEANLLAVADKKMALIKIDQAHWIGLKINALRFVN